MLHRRALLFIAVLAAAAVQADTLGFVQQKFSFLSFERGKWDRAAQGSCAIYSARQDDAIAEILRIGAGNLVPFKAKTGMKVVVCGDTASFDEGFDAGPLMTGGTSQSKR